MAYAFDTLGYAKRLRDAGIGQALAEAHAEAARDFIMVELVTKSDLNVAVDGLRRDLDALRGEMDSKFEKVSLQITIRLGALMVAGIGALALIMRLH